MEKRLYVITFGGSVTKRVGDRLETVGYNTPKTGYIVVTETPKTYKVQQGGTINIYRSIINKTEVNTINPSGYALAETMEKAVDIWNDFIRRRKEDMERRYRESMLQYNASIIE